MSVLREASVAALDLHQQRRDEGKARKKVIIMEKSQTTNTGNKPLVVGYTQCIDSLAIYILVLTTGEGQSQQEVDALCGILVKDECFSLAKQTSKT